jgi:hypothetical protein
MDEEYRIALLSLSKAASDSFESPWIWMDASHINEAGAKDWTQDGPYHIYSFNMDTGLYITCEPIIIL